MIDPNMQRYFQRIYGAKATPEILQTRPDRKKKRKTFINRLYKDSTKSPSIIFQDTYTNERRSSGEDDTVIVPSSSRLSSISDSNRSSNLSRKIDNFLSCAALKEKERNEGLRGSTRSLSSSVRSKRSLSSNKTTNHPMPDLSKVKSMLINSEHYQRPRRRFPKSRRSLSSERYNRKSILTSTDNESSQDSAYAGESSRQQTPESRYRRAVFYEEEKENSSSLQMKRYLKYLNEVTTDILAQKAYSTKSLNRILESRIGKYKKETSRREAIEMTEKLRRDLGISPISPSLSAPHEKKGPPVQNPQYTNYRRRERATSSAGKTRRKNSVSLDSNLVRSQSCDVLDSFSDKEIFRLLKDEAGLDDIFADDVVRVVRGRSESDLLNIPHRRRREDVTRSAPSRKIKYKNDEEEDDYYKDDEFEKCASDEDDICEEIDSSD